MTERTDPVAAARELRRLVDETIPTGSEALDRLVEASARALASGGKILFAGNGGSAAQCQHLATELVCRLYDDRRPYAAIALTTDTSVLTACANDYTFEHVFSRQIEALGREGDLLVALSTSGRSPNVLAAARTARERGLCVGAFTGAAPTPLGEASDHTIAVPSTDSARIQEVHLLLGHLLCAGIETR